MPHVLRKIDRVHYGLLQPDELARALKLDQNMPESRKLVAVRCECCCGCGCGCGCGGCECGGCCGCGCGCVVGVDVVDVVEDVVVLWM